MSSQSNTLGTAFMPGSLVTLLKRSGLRICGLGLVFIAIALFIMLIGFHPGDPSFNHATDRGPIFNPLGIVGAYGADLMLRTLGLASALLTVLMLGWGLRLIAVKPFSWMWVRFLVLPLALLLVAISAAAIQPGMHWPLTVGLGGFAGDLLLAKLQSGFAMIGVPGARALIALTSMILGFVLTIYCMAYSLSDWERLGGVLSYAAGKVIAGIRAVIPHGSNDEPISKRAPGSRQEPSLDKSKSKLGSAISTRKSEPKLAPDDSDDDDFDDDSVDNEPPVHIVAAPAAKLQPSQKAAAQRQASFDLGSDEYRFPPLDLLHEPDPADAAQIDQEALAQNARLLETVLQDFGVKGEIVQVRPGPVVTLYELEPAAGVKSSRVIGLADDIARSMSAIAARVAVVPGRNVIGIELPNARRETVHLHEILASSDFDKNTGKLNMSLGKDIGGTPVIADLAKMPHLLIAGTTGSGKSVGVNAMILSLLYRLKPEECRFIMIDPKMLELSIYDGIPHLLTPVVTDPHKAVVALKWAVREMEDRYRAMSQVGVRNIAGYNKRIKEAAAKGEQLTRRVQTGFDPETGKPIFEDQELPMEPLPFIVIIVDEMADLMLVAGKDVEASIQRLAQMARAAGLHLIMATQRPSVDVITGTIKANFPTRISYSVTSKIDSRTILGEMGAEQLLGQGDMLYMGQGGRLQRVHGPFVSDEEVESIVKHLRDQGDPAYLETVTEEPEEDPMAAYMGGGNAGAGGNGSDDDLYNQAVGIVLREKKASTSFIQRKLSIGYNRAARIIEQMEENGVVSAANHVGKREVLMENMDGSPYEY
ncbi:MULTISPECIES: DNA translocase FtsK [Thalassospira]|jgi:S-DNA-T family DNA segregation ATPase FtsK/SpoIIIE|uniref:DNA translocase FtsK n=4 Tax=Thalassospira TaxID=168934 RepID=A0A8I1SID7_9PROT|nr:MULTISPECIES: DNA translocase FtsK [Thalassospira]MEE3047495.1 DNA translocase FtsK 4TM domain-containing protein [Pseudomonadota bacterium]MBN8195490.1 DNA translocase FtsK 4TM domain-containing protein [Thalassospira povalilytica]MBO6770174.1 DNA translocase FtsK 4TM domain-containing protein [Thalassospira sp.]PKR49779.1 cell division protein FtsK [Thalassospira povalilytica]URK16911.1 DNA translocase FtsK 4TM domain-containing protein [Thalassospira sp. GO-4]